MTHIYLGVDGIVCEPAPAKDFRVSWTRCLQPRAIAASSLLLASPPRWNGVLRPKNAVTGPSLGYTKLAGHVVMLAMHASIGNFHNAA